MKKTLLGLSLILVVGLTASIAYAQTSKPANEQPGWVGENNFKENDWKDWHNEKIEWKRSQINKAADNNEITKEEAKTWDEHLNYMKEHHKENSHIPGGACHDGRHGRGHGHGWRMRHKKIRRR